MAIAYATLDHIVNHIDCFTFFVTHYPILAQLEHAYPGKVGNYHMAFFEEEKSVAATHNDGGDKEKGKEKEKEKENGHDTSMEIDEEEQLKGALPKYVLNSFFFFNKKERLIFFPLPLFFSPFFVV